MAKPILFYILARGGWGHGYGFRVIGVTSEKGRQTYGRDESDSPTHVGRFDVIYRFPDGTTEEFAKAARNRAEKVKERMKGGVANAEDEARRRRQEMDAAILRAAKGLAVGQPPPGRPAGKCPLPFCRCDTDATRDRDACPHWTPAYD